MYRRMETIIGVMRFLKSARIGLFLLVGGVGVVSAEDLSSRFGISGILGAGFPVGPAYVTEHTNSAGLDLGVLGSFYVGSHLGIGLSYESFNFGQGQRIAPIDMLFLYRMFPDRQWTPTFQIGGGSAKSVNSSRIENFNLKTGVGVDWFVAPSVAAGPQINYYFISHSADASTEAHIIGITLLVSYYFGSSYGTK